MIVLDASAALALVMGAEPSIDIRRHILEADTIHVPHLIDVEITHVIRRFTLARAVTEPEAERAFYLWRDMRVERHGHEPLLPRMWSLHHALTAYDACYVALAETLGAALVTRDAKLARSRGHHASIVLV